MTAPTRKALHAYLTDDAHNAWHKFADDCGVSLSAVLTALGLSLQEESEMTVGQKLDQVVARAEDAERQKRRDRRQAIAKRTVQKAQNKK